MHSLVNYDKDIHLIYKPNERCRCRREHGKHLQVPHAAAAELDDEQRFRRPHPAPASGPDARRRWQPEPQPILEPFQYAERQEPAASHDDPGCTAAAAAAPAGQGHQALRTAQVVVKLSYVHVRVRPCALVELFIVRSLCFFFRLDELQARLHR